MHMHLKYNNCKIMQYIQLSYEYNIEIKNRLCVFTITGDG